MGLLINLGQSLTRAGISFAAAQAAKHLLSKLVRKQIINNAVKLLLFVLAILIAHFSLFGTGASLFISSIILLALPLHSVITLAPKIIGLPYSLIWSLVQTALESEGPSDFVALFILRCHPWFFKLKTKFDEKLNGWIPTAGDLVDYVWGYVSKQVIVFVVTLAGFLVAFNFVAKPMLQSAVMGVSGFKIYLLPFSMAVDYLFKKNITQWLIG